MKKPIYDTYDAIPEADRTENNYHQVTETGSPNHGKWILTLDATHPVMMKNSELIGKQTTDKAAHAQAIAAKDAEILNLKQQPAAGVPAGHVAVSQEDFNNLQQYKTLGDFATVKDRNEKYPVLEAKENERTLEQKLAEVAEKFPALDVKVFTRLAKDAKLLDRIEERTSTDTKGVTTTIPFVKPAQGQSGEAKQLDAFLKEDPDFKDFTHSLFPPKEKQKVIVPDNRKTDDDATVKDAADTYLESMYGTGKEEK